MTTTNTRFVTKNGLDANGNSITNLGVSGASLTMSGANAVTITSTGATNITLPTSGTLATTTGSVATVTTAAQPSITSVGTLTSLAIGATSASSAALTVSGGAGVELQQSGPLPVTSTTGTLRLGYLNGTITSVDDAFVAWASANASATQAVGSNGTLVLAGRNNVNSGLSLVTGNTSRLFISNAGGWGLSGANYGTSGQVLTSSGNAAPTWGTPAAAAGTLTGATLAAGVTASSLTSVGTLTGLTVAGTILQNVATPITYIRSTSATDATLQLQNTVTGTAAANGTFLGVYGSDGHAALYNYHSSDLVLGTNNKEQFRIVAAGAWQIGGGASQSAGTAGQVITTNGSATQPTWQFVGAGALTGTTLASNVVTSSLTTVGTLVSGTKVNSTGTAGASLNVGGSLAVDTNTSSIPLAGTAGALQLGYLNGTVTSTQDAYVAWGGVSAAATLSPGQQGGTLILSSRNASTAGISLATAGLSRMFISSAGVVNVNNTAASSPVININKNDSGTANQSGGALYLINTHAANTARTANTLAGQMVWQFSQPTSGSPQNAAAIAVYSDGAQAGLKTPSYMSFLTTDSTDGGATLERLRITSTGVTQFKGAYDEQSTAVTATASTTLDLSTANTFTITLGVSITTLAFSNVPASGRVASVTLVINHSVASTTITWPASVKWSGGTAPTLTTTAGKTDIISLMTPDGGTTWYGFVAGLNF